MKILVAGAGGAIGGHLVGTLLRAGHDVRAVDIKPMAEWWQVHKGAQSWAHCDLTRDINARASVDGARHVYDLAECMGGIGYITANKVVCAESIEIGIQLLRASAAFDVERFFFSSSACVYPIHLQQDAGYTPALTEYDAWPAEPEDGYGFAKLYMEELCRHYSAETGLKTRIARYHNVYGAPGSWNDGKEKSPAAICRKVAEAVLADRHSIEIWGDGRQVRSFMHVSDCVAGSIALMNSEYGEPMNLGSDQSISINELVSVVEVIAGTRLLRTYDIGQPRGVAGRNADISLAFQELGWQPHTTLVDGLTGLYRWILDALRTGASGADTPPLVPTTVGPV